MTALGNLEASVQNAQPYELYRFQGDQSGPSPFNRYLTSFDQSRTYLGNVYNRQAISRTAVSASKSNSGPEVTINLPDFDPLAKQLIVGLPVSPIAVTIFRGDLNSSEIVPIFIGQITSVEISGGIARFQCVGIQTQLAGKIARIPTQRICPFFLYDSMCQVDKANFDMAGTVSTITWDVQNRQVITVPAISGIAATDKTYFEGGYIVRNTDGSRGFITRMSATQLTLLAPVLTLAVGDALTLYAGCDRTLNVCRDRFNNAIHHGGFPLIPNQNPAEGQGLSSGVAAK